MGSEIVIPDMGILFEDKHCTLRLLYEDNQADAKEWWWEEPESRTVFIVYYSAASYPSLTVHRMTASQAQMELDKLFLEGWIVKTKHKPEFLKVPSAEIMNE